MLLGSLMVEILYLVIVLVVIFLLFRYIKRKYFTKVLATFIDNFELDYIKNLREQLEGTVKYSYPNLNKNTDFKEIYNQHFNTMLKNSYKYIDEYESYLSKINSTMDIVIELKEYCENSYFALNTEYILNNLNSMYQDREKNKLHLSATPIQYLYIINYLNYQIKRDICFGDHEKYAVTQLELALKKNLANFNEYNIHKRTIFSITKLMKDFDEEKLPYLTRLLELLKYDGEHYFNSFRDIKLFSGKQIKEIKDFIEYFFYTEILKNDFKNIGQLFNIILEMQIKYNARDKDGLIYQGKGHIQIDVLSNLFTRLDFVYRELNWSIDKTIKKLL